MKCWFLFDPPRNSYSLGPVILGIYANSEEEAESIGKQLAKDPCVLKVARPQTFEEYIRGIHPSDQKEVA